MEIKDIFLTVESWTSSLVTLRRVRELHPVSRHVFPLRSESGSVLRSACCLSFGKDYRRGVSGNFEELPRRRKPRGETCTDAQHAAVSSHSRLGLSACGACVPASRLTAGGAADSVRYHLPSSFPLNGPCVTLAGARRHSSAKQL